MGEKLKVIWIDDEIKKFNSLINEAYDDYDIEITQFECWAEAKKELDKKTSDYAAIIIEAICKYDEKSDPDIEDFLWNVHPELPVSLPRFIFTALGVSESIRKLTPKPTDPDYEWKIKNNRCFYLKDKDKEALFENIRAYGKKLLEYKIKNYIYGDVFKAIGSLGLHQEVSDNLTKLLKPIRFGVPSEGYEEYNDKAQLFRKCLEHIFRSMYENGMLPMACVNQNTGGRVNISGSCSFFKEFFASKLISELAAGVKSVASMMLHTSKNENDNFYSYCKQTQSPYLLQSLSLWLCDFILWYDKHTNEHDKEWNKSQWQGPKTASWEGSEGKLKWNNYKEKWTIDSETFLDDKEPGCKDPHAYTEGQKCLYIRKEAGNKTYAIGVEIIED